MKPEDFVSQYDPMQVCAQHNPCRRRPHDHPPDQFVYRVGHCTLAVTIPTLNASLDFRHPRFQARVASGPRRAIRALAVRAFADSRVVTLAHWASDVVAGFAIGAPLQRLLRLWTGYPPEGAKESDDAEVLKKN